MALLLLLTDPTLEVAGVSTVFGNAPLEVTDSVTRALEAALARAGIARPPVFRGAAAPRRRSSAAQAAAYAALRDALAADPLTIVALGPLTNLAAALERRPQLQQRVVRLVAVMGRRAGHLFHPAEGRGTGGMLLGHGPVFSDFNFEQDPDAAAAVLAAGMPTTLVPYDVARDVTLDGEDLARLRDAGGASAWVGARSQAWLDFWKRDVGRDGFFPFDLLAAAYAVAPRFFGCADARAWVGRDGRLWGWLWAPRALIVGLERERPRSVRASGRVIYCTRADPALREWLVARLAPPGGRRPEAAR